MVPQEYAAMENEIAVNIHTGEIKEFDAILLVQILHNVVINIYDELELPSYSLKS